MKEKTKEKSNSVKLNDSNILKDAKIIAIKIEEDEKQIDLSFLLNLLDGTLETSGRIIAISTNQFIVSYKRSISNFYNRIIYVSSKHNKNAIY